MRSTAHCLLVALALAACGERDPSLAFEEKICGTIDTPRDPIEPVTAGGMMSGAASRLPDGSIRIILNPVVGASGEVLATLSPDDVGVNLEGSAAATFALNVAGEIEAVPTDIVFVIDTTSSMFWAIDGVKQGVQSFVEVLHDLHFDTRVGGIEFGDEIRTSQELTDVPTFERWVEKLGVTGGGDGPESPLDSMLSAWNSMAFRPGAQRYMIMITDVGFHERGDRSDCSDVTLKEVADEMRGQVFFGLVHGAGVGGPGVHPDEIRKALGGIVEQIELDVVITGFDVSVDTTLDDAMGATHVITVPASADTDAATEVTVDRDGSSVTLPIESAEG